MSISVHLFALFHGLFPELQADVIRQLMEIVYAVMTEWHYLASQVVSDGSLVDQCPPAMYPDSNCLAEWHSVCCCLWRSGDPCSLDSSLWVSTSLLSNACSLQCLPLAMQHDNDTLSMFLTCYGPLDNTAILQLHCHSLLLALHQKPAQHNRSISNWVVKSMTDRTSFTILPTIRNAEMLLNGHDGIGTGHSANYRFVSHLIAFSDCSHVHLGASCLLLHSGSPDTPHHSHYPSSKVMLTSLGWCLRSMLLDIDSFTKEHLQLPETFCSCISVKMSLWICEFELCFSWRRGGYSCHVVCDCVGIGWWDVCNDFCDGDILVCLPDQSYTAAKLRQEPRPLLQADTMAFKAKIWRAERNFWMAFLCFVTWWYAAVGFAFHVSFRLGCCRRTIALWSSISKPKTKSNNWSNNVSRSLNHLIDQQDL